MCFILNILTVIAVTAKQRRGLYGQFCTEYAMAVRAEDSNSFPPSALVGGFMSYLEFNVETELRKVARGRKSKVEPYVLLRMIAEDYLALTGAEDAARRDDSVDFLERLYGLEVPCRTKTHETV